MGGNTCRTRGRFGTRGQSWGHSERAGSSRGSIDEFCQFVSVLVGWRESRRSDPRLGRRARGFEGRDETRGRKRTGEDDGSRATPASPKCESVRAFGCRVHDGAASSLTWHRRTGRRSARYNGARVSRARPVTSSVDRLTGHPSEKALCRCASARGARIDGDASVDSLTR